MDQTGNEPGHEYVQKIAELRAADRLMRQGARDLATAYAVLQQYEEGLVMLLDSAQLVEYIQARMDLADLFK